MKKNNTKKLQFNSFSVTELNIFQLSKIIGGAEDNTASSTDTCKTQSGPRDGYSKDCNQ